MKRIFVIAITSICLIVASCKTKDNPEPEPNVPPDYALIDVITGIDLFDENGNPLGRWNAPNQNPGDGFVFPNPSTGVVSVFNPEKIVRVWLIPANCVIDSITMDISSLSEDLSYEIKELEDAQIKDISIPDFNNQISLNFSNVDKGFYKLFYQLEMEELFWQNLFIDPSATNIPTYEDLDAACE